ncbi:ArsR/SmtB family transcription factor [Paramicrobacterium agarici]|uniref:ArsR/SmtB family transcription factor n=1 Tax=Paramicrobacterium agarici TaxID=630514 RepID=UPI0011504AB7|nr:helix-turn-helix domain-containing protein [Microbacterium agarici]TQO21449.1 helix-turn-helix protein [Microbacterium agarici]
MTSDGKPCDTAGPREQEPRDSRGYDERSDDTNVMTDAMLKAWTHPLRRRIIRVLARRVHARAADLAQELDVAPNSVSFHLRTLADAGLIEEAPERARDRRDRVWTPVKGSWTVGTPEHPVADEVLAGTLMQNMVEDHYDLVRRSSSTWMDFVAGHDSGAHSNFMHMNVPMDRDTAEEFFRTISAMAADAAERFHPDDPDVHVWEIDVIAADDTV